MIFPCRLILTENTTTVQKTKQKVMKCTQERNMHLANERDGKMEKGGKEEWMKCDATEGKSNYNEWEELWAEIMDKTLQTTQKLQNRVRKSQCQLITN